jgi:putative aldouronate transport system substrate-binding protein
LGTIPVQFNDSADGNRLGRAFYRSFGGVIDGWYAVSGGKYQSVFRDPTFKQSSMEINKWWREGLFSPTQFTDTGDQILEKIVAGRTALLWYDHSSNETNKFRTILRETFPDDSYEITPDPFPPANGLSPDKIYADNQGTVGWNVTVITKNAEKPQRIFDLWTWLLTKEGSITMMYGPQGENWDSLNDKGLPILKKAESELKSEEIDRLGSWFWAIPGQSDNVDTTKFAVNDLQPAEKQNWVIKTQAHILTPRMWLTDEFTGIPDVVDPKSDAGIARTLCEDYIKANYPKMIMAKTEAEAQKIFDGINAFLDKNGFGKVEEAYDAKYQANVKLVGSGLTK